MEKKPKKQGVRAGMRPRAHPVFSVTFYQLPEQLRFSVQSGFIRGIRLRRFSALLR